MIKSIILGRPKYLTVGETLSGKTEMKIKTSQRKPQKNNSLFVKLALL
jgi:hypothetical protein